MSEKFSIDIKDFQSLKRATLEIDKGLNIVVGRSNAGKSAIIRAIDSVIFNTPDDSHVRVGQRYYGVVIDNGSHKMMFLRDGNGKSEKTAYQFDGGTVQKKVGRGQLPEVSFMFNIRDVKMQNGNKVKLNFWYQNDKPFLMGLTPGQLYEFLSISSCEKYSKILKTMIADGRVLKTDLNNLTVEIDTLKSVNLSRKEFIDRNVGFDDVYKEAVRVDREATKQESEEQLVQSVKELGERISSCRVEVDRAIEVESQSAQKVANISILRQEFNDLYRRYSVNNELGYRVSARITQIKEVKDGILRYDDLLSTNDSVVSRSNSEISDLSQVIKRFSEVSVMADRVRQSLGQVQAVQEKLTDLRSLPEIDDDFGERLEKVVADKNRVQGISELIDSISNLDGQLKKLCGIISGVEGDILQNDRELDQIKADVGYCPFCGTVFDGHYGHNCEEE